MPKTWDKSHDWIFEHKLAFDKNQEQFGIKVNEVEEQQQNTLNEINDKLDIQKTELTNQHAKLIQKQEHILTKTNELLSDIDNSKIKHQEFNTKQKEAEKNEARHENMINTYQITIKSCEKMKINNAHIQEQLGKAIEYADTNVTNTRSDIGNHVTLADLNSSLADTESKIKANGDNLQNQFIHISNTIDNQNIESLKDISKASETYIATMNSSNESITASRDTFNEIDRICGNIKNSQLPKIDDSKLKKKLEKRDKAYKDLINFSIF